MVTTEETRVMMAAFRASVTAVAAVVEPWSLAIETEFGATVWSLIL